MQVTSAQWNADRTQPVTQLSQSQLINPEELVKVLQSGKNKLVILNIGSRMLYLQVHITGPSLSARDPNQKGSSSCAHACNRYRTLRRLFFTAGAVPGRTARTLTRPTRNFTRWVSPTSRCSTSLTISEPTGYTKAIRRSWPSSESHMGHKRILLLAAVTLAAVALVVVDRQHHTRPSSQAV